MQSVFREPRFKHKRIILHKSEILHDIDTLTYKLAETSVAIEARDNVASDSEDRLDGEVLDKLMESREAIIRKKLNFCLEDDLVSVVDNTPSIEADFIFDLKLPCSFKDNELKTAVKIMHDYMVKGTLMDWYTHIGTGYGAALATEVLQLESRVADVFRKPGFVDHPSHIYIPSYRTR